MNLRTRIASGIVAAVSALALIAATAPAAEAGGATKGNGTLPSRCSGSKVGEKKKGKFHLEVYYSSAIAMVYFVSRCRIWSSPRAERIRSLASCSRSPVRGSCGRYPSCPERVT